MKCLEQKDTRRVIIDVGHALIIQKEMTDTNKLRAVLEDRLENCQEDICGNDKLCNNCLDLKERFGVLFVDERKAGVREVLELRKKVKP